MEIVGSKNRSANIKASKGHAAHKSGRTSEVKVLECHHRLWVLQGFRSLVLGFDTRGISLPIDFVFYYKNRNLFKPMKVFPALFLRLCIYHVHIKF